METHESDLTENESKEPFDEDKENEIENKSVQCDICEKTFAGTCSKLEHMKITHWGWRSQCVNCHKQFKYRKVQSKCSDGQDHKVEFKRCSNPMENYFNCKQCEFKAESQKSLREHWNEVHCADIRQINGQYSCERCYKTFTRKDSCYRHIQEFHQSKLYICDLCDIAFKAQRGYERHRKRVHNGLKGIDHRSGKFECDYCDKICSRKDTLKRHVKQVHQTNFEFKCDDCGKHFARSDKFKEHLKAHQEGKKFYKIQEVEQTTENIQEQKEFSCKFCDAGFNSLDNFQNHVKKLHPTKNFSCEVCADLFTTKKLLKRHKNVVHNKVHKCDKCEEVFDDLKHLNIHVKSIHLNYELECVICKDMFKSIYILNKHMRNRHPSKKKQFQCEICEATCSTKENLAKHVKESHSDERHACPHCDKVLKRKRTLFSHMKICKITAITA